MSPVGTGLTGVEGSWTGGALPPNSALIFVNYRTSDEPYAALFLDKRLTERFGRGRIFRDSRTIRPGAYFPAEIWRALQGCQAMIVVVGERWLRADPDGRRRIDDPTDYVRMEIGEALRRDILVVPVLVDDASLPWAGALPPDIAKLASRQYLHVRFRSADHDASRLVDELVERLGGAGLRAPYPARPRWAGGDPPPGFHSRHSNLTINHFNGSADAPHADLASMSHLHMRMHGRG